MTDQSWYSESARAYEHGRRAMIGEVRNKAVARMEARLMLTPRVPLGASAAEADVRKGLASHPHATRPARTARGAGPWLIRPLDARRAVADRVVDPLGR